jgi:hypothetical protein
LWFGVERKEVKWKKRPGSLEIEYDGDHELDELEAQCLNQLESSEWSFKISVGVSTLRIYRINYVLLCNLIIVHASTCSYSTEHSLRMIEKLLLVNPVVLSALPRDNLALFEPESNLLLGIFNTVRAMTDIPAHVDSVVAGIARP